MRVWVEGYLDAVEVDAVVEVLRERGVKVIGFDGEEVRSGDDIWWGAGAGIDDLWVTIEVRPPKVVDVIKRRGWRLCLWKSGREIMPDLNYVAVDSFATCKTYKKMKEEYRYKIMGVVDMDMLKLIGHKIDDIVVKRSRQVYWFSGKVLPEVMVERLYPIFSGVGFRKGIVHDKMVATIMFLERDALHVYRAVEAVKMLCKDGDEETLRLARVVTGLPIRRCSELDRVKYRGFVWEVVIGLEDNVNSQEIAVAGMVDAVRI